MKLSEAIETQETYLKGEEAVEHDKLIEAQRLGLEYMKRELKMRQEYPDATFSLLPGETED